MLSSLLKTLSTIAFLIFISCFDTIFQSNDDPVEGSGDDDDIVEVVENIFRDPDITPVRRVLRSVMPVCYAANLTVAALCGETFPNVTIAEVGDSMIGAFLVYIEIDDDFPLPEGVFADGRLIVAGYHADYEAIIMTVIFTEMNITEGAFTLKDVSTFPVLRFDDNTYDSANILIAYADYDFNAGSDTLLTVNISDKQVDFEFQRLMDLLSFDTSLFVQEEGWVIYIDDNNTPADAVDDRYKMIGAVQSVEMGSLYQDIIQMVFYDFVMSPVCKLNPIEGFILYNNLGVSLVSGIKIGQVLFTAPSECDGTITVLGATGVYVTSWGKSFPLDLDHY